MRQDQAVSKQIDEAVKKHLEKIGLSGLEELEDENFEPETVDIDDETPDK